LYFVLRGVLSDYETHYYSPRTLMDCIRSKLVKVWPRVSSLF